MSHMRMGGYWVGAVALGLAVGLGYVIRARADGIPPANTLSYSGTLSNSSGPLSGSHTVTVSLYNAATGGTQQCTSGPTIVTVSVIGSFSVPLPVTCTPYVAGSPNEWVDVNVDGTDTGTVQIGAVPYAVTANNAVTADNPSDAGTLAPSLLARPSAMNVSLTGLTGGSVNGTSKQLLVQAGTYVAAASGGDVAVPFKADFPNGLLSVTAIAGDQADGYMAVTAYDLTGFTVSVSGTTSGGVRVNWMAIGW